MSLDPIPAALLHWAPPPAKVRYARVGQAGPFELPRAILEEVWGAPWEEDGELRFRRKTWDRTAAEGDGKLVEDALISYGPEGLRDLGTYAADGTLSLWTPPQVVLPAEPAPDATWEAVHHRGEEESRRTVELRRDGDHLLSVAELRRPGAVMVLRMRFAAGDGFQGYEALIQRDGQPPIRTWTEALTVQPRR
jgi:hypothetical protein